MGALRAIAAAAETVAGERGAALTAEALSAAGARVPLHCGHNSAWEADAEARLGALLVAAGVGRS